MADTKELISTLNAKVQDLLNSIKNERAILAEKNNELESLRQKISEKDAKIESLESENEALKAAPVEDKKDAEEMKAKIGELVKEIDNCISLLKV